MKLTHLFFLFAVFVLCTGFDAHAVVEPPAMERQQFDIESETAKYINTLSGEEKEQSDAYFEGGYWLILWGILLEFFIAWVFLAKGLAKKIVQWSARITARPGWHDYLVILFYSIIAYVLIFPWTLYTDFFREHQYGLSNQSFGEWMGDEIISLLLFASFFGSLFTCLYVAIRKVGRTWWIWGSAITFLFLILGLFITPVFINPLFNEYKPLEDGPVRNSILSMARANGVPVDNVYMFDASKQSDRISANVSGIGSTIRISLNDNLMNQCNEAEIKAVMGHELGHYVLNHSHELLLAFGLTFLFGFAFVNWTFGWSLSKWGGDWGIKGLSDVTGFPLFMLLINLFFFFATPVTNSIIRTNEEEADIFGLNAAREPDGFASVSMKLSTYRKISPGYWERMIFFDHPSGHDRVSMSMEWKAENLKE